MQTFDVEHRAFDEARQRLVQESDGKYVVIKGTDISPAQESFSDALTWGYGQYSLSGFCVKQVAARDPVIHLSERFSPCAG